MTGLHAIVAEENIRKRVDVARNPTSKPGYVKDLHDEAAVALQACK
jgi:hypothetical protein